MLGTTESQIINHLEFSIEDLLLKITQVTHDYSEPEKKEGVKGEREEKKEENGQRESVST